MLRFIILILFVFIIGFFILKSLTIYNPYYQKRGKVLEEKMKENSKMTFGLVIIVRINNKNRVILKEFPDIPDISKEKIKPFSEKYRICNAKGEREQDFLNKILEEVENMFGKEFREKIYSHIHRTKILRHLSNIKICGLYILKIYGLYINESESELVNIIIKKHNEIRKIILKNLEEIPILIEHSMSKVETSAVKKAFKTLKK